MFFISISLVVTSGKRSQATYFPFLGFTTDNSRGPDFEGFPCGIWHVVQLSQQTLRWNIFLIIHIYISFIFISAFIFPFFLSFPNYIFSLFLYHYMLCICSSSNWLTNNISKYFYFICIKLLLYRVFHLLWDNALCVLNLIKPNHIFFFESLNYIRGTARDFKFSNKRLNFDSFSRILKMKTNLESTL